MHTAKCLALMVFSGALLQGHCWSLDINQASEMELDNIKGLGPRITAEIMHQRAIQPFVDWRDFVSRVKGMGPVKQQQLCAAGLTVGSHPCSTSVTAPVARSSPP